MLLTVDTLLSSSYTPPPPLPSFSPLPNQSFIESLTVVLPYSPVGTMERVTEEGTVATASTYAHLFSSLPNCGKPTRLMVYDLHTLQNR